MPKKLMFNCARCGRETHHILHDEEYFEDEGRGLSFSKITCTDCLYPKEVPIKFPLGKKPTGDNIEFVEDPIIFSD